MLCTHTHSTERKAIPQSSVTRARPLANGEVASAWLASKEEPPVLDGDAVGKAGAKKRWKPHEGESGARVGAKGAVQQGQALLFNHSRNGQMAEKIAEIKRAPEGRTHHAWRGREAGLGDVSEMPAGGLSIVEWSRKAGVKGVDLAIVTCHQEVGTFRRARATNNQLFGQDVLLGGLEEQDQVPWVTL